MKELKDKKLIFGIGIAFLFLATIGLSYAYFTATLVNKDVKDQIVQTGTLSLKYTDGPEINAKNIKPGWTISKTVTIENTGTLDAFYTIYWKDLLNEITNDELVMSLECDSSTDTCSSINFENTVITTEANPISENIFISPGEIQTITLNFEFKELSKDQNYNQNKKFNGVINIKDSSSTVSQKEYTMYARVIDQDNNPIANKTIELQTDNKTGTTNESGYVKVEGLKQGNHELIVRDENDILDTRNISISQKKESDVLDNKTIYVDTTLSEFTVTITLNNENKMESITNLIVPPDECFNVYDDSIYNYDIKDICPKELIVPNKVGEKIITQISREPEGTLHFQNGAFENKKIKKVVISNGITRIDYKAFFNNNLTSIIIPNSVTSIGYEAFMSNNLINIEIPNSVTSISGSAFSRNELPDSQAIIYKRNGDGSEDKTTIVSYGGKSKQIIIPESVTTIGDSAFSYNNLTSVTLPNGITSIGDSTFENNKLINVTIPDGITSIGDYAFRSNELINITIPESVTIIGQSAFYNNKLTNIIIPNTVTSIGEFAFSSNKLTNVSIPTSVTLIEKCAFNNNELPDSQAYIYSRKTDGSEDKTTIVSYGGKNKDITIPNGVTSIGSYAFSNNNLTSVTILNSVKTIEWGAFIDNNLKQVVIQGKTSSSKFTIYDPSWGWASDVTCVKDNTRNVTNGCITWGA